jgi:hypothetical protein
LVIVQPAPLLPFTNYQLRVSMQQQLHDDVTMGTIFKVLQLYKAPQIYAGFGVGGLAIAACRQPSEYRRGGLQTAITGVLLG